MLRSLHILRPFKSWHMWLPSPLYSGGCTPPSPPFLVHCGPEGPAQRAKRATRATRATSREAARNQYLKLHTRQTKCRRLDGHVLMTRQTNISRLATKVVGNRQAENATHNTAELHWNCIGAGGGRPKSTHCGKVDPNHALARVWCMFASPRWSPLGKHNKSGLYVALF